jgi:triacylglycerol lipase
MCLDFADTWGSNVDHAAEIGAAVRRLRDRTGSPLVDIVAHSMGGLATRWFIAFSSQPAPVRSVIFIATPHRGTWTSLLAWGDSAAELRPDSDFLRTLRNRPFPDHIRTFTIRTRLETHVMPATSAMWPGSVDDRLVSFPPHAFLPRSRSVACLISEWLGRPQQVNRTAASRSTRR